LTTKKDHETLLRAFSDVARSEPSARLYLIGDGPLRLRIEWLVHELGVERVVQLLGARSDVPELLPAFDVVALASRHEALGLALIEAMAAGVCVVAADVGGVREVVVDQQTGLLFPQGSADQLASALLEVIRDPDLRSRLAGAGQVSMTRFSSHRATARIEAIYRELVYAGASRGDQTAGRANG
jgi:glycosyltransferase involved in cell wall biosynthesis